MEDLLQKTQVAGIALSVSQSDSMIYSQAWGMADVEGEIRMKPTTRVRTASVAKVLTATALGKLATDGKLDFDKPLKTYLPTLKAPYANLTTRQIAGHTAGIPHRPASQKAQNKHYTNVKETLPFFDEVSLLFEPDMAYQY
ncbi:MAG: serine hydrolase domain-containing protein, partial [Bacteroidota bacterium]